MGLDISAYRKLQKLDCVFDADGEPIDAVSREPVNYDFFAYVNPDFPGRQGSIEHMAIYSAEEGEAFNAGSYGGYNTWRESLARLAGYPLADVERYGKIHSRHDQGAFNAESGPFWEMIVFSDCEGVLGAEVCAKLAEDFAKFDSVAKAIHGTESYFYVKYQEWKNAFEMAADSGAVDFH